MVGVVLEGFGQSKLKQLKKDAMIQNVPLPLQQIKKSAPLTGEHHSDQLVVEQI